MSKYAWMFPNPGAHVPGALGPLVTGRPQLRTLLKRIDEVAADYGWSPVAPLLLDGTEPGGAGPGAETGRFWLSCYSTSLVVSEILKDAAVPCDVMLGHSSGELSALAAAGSLALEDGARLVCERIRSVEESQLPDGALLALNSFAERVEHLCAAVDEGSLAVAVDNGASQVVASGRTAAIVKLERLAAALEIGTTRLEAPGAFHNRLLGPAARRFAEATADVPLRAPDTPVYSPQLGRYLRTTRDVRELLDGLLVLPVGFRAALTTLYDSGVRTFVECGARQVLSGLVPEILPAAARAVPMLTSRLHAQSFDETVRRLTGIRQPPPVGVQAPPPPASSPVPAPTRGLPPRDEMIAEVRQAYADELQYPVDVFDGDPELESELGVSSLKQTQVFVQLLDKYSLPTPTSEVRVFTYRTVPQIVDLLRQLDGPQ